MTNSKLPESPNSETEADDENEVYLNVHRSSGPICGRHSIADGSLIRHVRAHITRQFKFLIGTYCPSP
jgi:hypothetical protein